MGCVSSEPIEVSALDLCNAKSRSLFLNEQSNTSKVLISVAKVKDGKLYGEEQAGSVLPSFQVERQPGQTPRPDSKLGKAEAARRRELKWEEEIDIEWYDYYYLKPRIEAGDVYDKATTFKVGKYNLPAWVPFKSPKVKGNENAARQ